MKPTSVLLCISLWVAGVNAWPSFMDTSIREIVKREVDDTLPVNGTGNGDDAIDGNYAIAQDTGLEVQNGDGMEPVEGQETGLEVKKNVDDKDADKTNSHVINAGGKRRKWKGRRIQAASSDDCEKQTGSASDIDQKDGTNERKKGCRQKTKAGGRKGKTALRKKDVKYPGDKENRIIGDRSKDRKGCQNNLSACKQKTRKGKGSKIRT